MSYTSFKGSFPSTNKIDTVNYYICEPESQIRAILQFAHGWVDCFERNKELISYFTDHGILVCGCDFIGHDFNRRNQGDFRRKNAWTYLVQDLCKLSRYMRKTYPDVPIYLYGHGLGSLVARIAVNYDESYDGLIISGTSGKQHFCRRSILFSRLLKIWKGADYESPLIEAMMQRKVNARFLKENDTKAWECSDPDHRIANNLGAEGAAFYTAGALRDMFHMLSMVSSDCWYRSLPDHMPILLISGQDDPVGSYGKGIREIDKKLKKTGHQVETHLYIGMRHNLQDEPQKEKVFSDILSWMKSYIND
ncbi:MAG: alpha/beta hydrolase [Eubacterium sp.]|nr:alpha/beta hydrolase [Eubacterium sp.]